jgi:hypothetical protein
VIDCFVSRPHYWTHVEPVWNALRSRGTLWAPPELAIPGSRRGKPRGSVPALVAGWRDSNRVGRAILMEHGAGQSYGADPRCARDPSYAGGDERGNVELFLMPGPHPARRQREATPHVPVVEVGCPALDRWTARSTAREPDLVALAFHWPNGLTEESQPALDHYRAALPALARRFRVVGHGHPRARGIRAEYRAAGIPWAGYDDVMSRAAVLVVDNSSIGFEFAAAGGAVVWLDAPWYRRHHGLRFFDACPERITEAVDLPHAVDLALSGRYGRETRVGDVYSVRDGTAACRAAHAIHDVFARAA